MNDANETNGGKIGSYHVCAKCGYTDKGQPRPKPKGFTPLREKCPKCGADEFYLRNIHWV